ncbi:4,5-dihydroxyphthalate decarboxylase [Pseudonocardia hierapolitana]|uniref:4,5-dihydroxyphthalate decarboxylase n=1 Tax=Pseudonocardia hierapolitana TaxID=1128676 RepID=A0A561T4H4_9PSEU|nr:ABC transporter substrate-binding protein [Pseudonocardia hierapolitana]TWF82013.1 4,5-dihydroxyphthalate decarboxylase [Pseudonocardia hierapolitana]
MQEPGPVLRTVIRTQGANEALKSGEVTPRGFRFEFEEVPVLASAFRRMVRELAYDVSEMAVTTYLVAKEHGVELTALPVFLARGLHHGVIQVATAGGIRHPKDLEGRRVGVDRGYTVTTGVWARSILSEEYGVDLDEVTWVLSGDEHVAQYRPPGNVVPVKPPRSLEDLLRSGKLAAVLGARIDAPDVTPLIPDPEDAALTALQERGLYPINHLVVVRDEVLRERPDIAADIFDAFVRAKQVYVDRLADDGIASPSATDRLNRQVLELTGADPLPYGIDPNREMLERLVRTAVDQKILSRPVKLENVFAAGAHQLEG